MSRRHSAWRLLAALAALAGFAAPAPAPAFFAGDGQSAAAHAGARARSPVRTAEATGPERVGYVHYYLLRGPDEKVDIHVGIELTGGRIAWSFPGLGVVVAPFIDEGTVPVGESEYELWHLYGIRPFPDDASMNTLRAELTGRVQRWVDGGVPYCENDGARGDCMSCLGFVLRVLFPGKRNDFPDMPAGFRAEAGARYTTRELLLYLTGMYDLSTREARLKRISQLALPEALRDDLLDLVHAMGPDETPAIANGAPQEKRRVSARPAQRKRL